MKTQKALVVIYWKASPENTEKQVLVFRVTEARGGFWQPVTGKVEKGESFLEGALREAEEETGIRFERQPQYLGLEYEFEGRWGPAVERAFFLPIYSPSPPAPKLDRNEHVEFRWVTPEEAIKLVKFPHNKEAIKRVTFAPPPLFLSKGGKLFQEGEEITHERTLTLFLKSMVQTPSGQYLVKLGNEELDVVVEDTPLFVKSYARDTGLLSLSDGTKEKLKPETLEIIEGQSFCCTTERGWDARFLSPAYYEITKDVTEDSSGKGYVLHFLGKSYQLRVPH
ncbi:MAG: NUDIX hydrolase [Bdellovibrionota bacterium]